jgi:hypothetical protein
LDGKKVLVGGSGGNITEYDIEAMINKALGKAKSSKSEATPPSTGNL